MPLPYPFPFSFLGDEATDSSVYARQLKQLLPRGPLWNLEADSFLSKTLSAIADELFRLDLRGRDLIEESDPRTANETIEQWEEMVSLPDESIPEIPATLAERRLAVTQKYTAVGGQSEAFFLDLALACGYVVTISSTTMLRCETGRVGDRVYGSAYAFSMQFDVEAPIGTALSTDDFERVIRHHTHAHITVVFNYL